MGVFGGMAKMNGFIKLHRQILDWEWYDNPNVFSTFIHCLFKANWKDKSWHGIDIKRGSFVTNQIDFAREIGITRQQLRTCLNKLKSTSEITIKTTVNYTYISINNYDKYQPSTSEATNDQPTDNQRITNTEEYKERKNIRINTNTPTPFVFDEKVIKELSEQFGVSKTFVQDTYAQMKDWMASKGKTYKDEKAGFRNWLRSKAKENGIIPKPQIIHKEKTPHQIIAELEAKERMQNANN